MENKKVHPVHAIKDGILNTFSRKQVNLNQPTVESICIEDIAHALSNICRFAGHSSEFYSVAQHSSLVAYLAPKELRMVALLHDAPEAYLHDISSPLKQILGQPYHNLEYAFDNVIAEKFGIDKWYFKKSQIKEFDKRAVEIEFNYFFEQGTELTRVFGTERTCWSPDVAKENVYDSLRTLSILLIMDIIIFLFYLSGSLSILLPIVRFIVLKKTGRDIFFKEGNK